MGITAINNKGQIIGQGYTRNENSYFEVVRPFLRSPITFSTKVPETNTVGGIFLAGIGLVYLRRR